MPGISKENFKTQIDAKYFRVGFYTKVVYFITKYLNLFGNLLAA
jgi:hypothetical protein